MVEEKENKMCFAKTTHCLQIPFKSTERACFNFLLSTLINCFIFILNFAADLIVAIQYFYEKHSSWGFCTLTFMFAPAFVYFILMTSRPDWWMSDKDKSNRIQYWFMKQLLQLIFFPFFALYRHASLIVLYTDALLLSGQERQKSLNTAATPASIELYFFLQAWLQAAPQALLQSYVLIRERICAETLNSVAAFILCIFMSIIIITVKTTSFQRYESQRTAGRKLPWAKWFKKYKNQEDRNMDDGGYLGPVVWKVDNVHNDPQNAQDFCLPDSNHGIQFEQESLLTPPLPPKNVKVVGPPTPMRGVTSINALSVPDVLAPPRPDSATQVSVISNRSLGTIAFESDAKLPKKKQDLQVLQDKYSLNGLKDHDILVPTFAFLRWFFFILSRIVTISTFCEIFPFYLMGILGLHYILMLIYLFYYAKYCDITTFIMNMCLGLVYIIAVIEYRIKFKYANKWLNLYYAFTFLQNGCMTVGWFWYSFEKGVMYTYIFYFIFVSMGICILSHVCYCLLLKSKKRLI